MPERPGPNPERRVSVIGSTSSPVSTFPSPIHCPTSDRGQITRADLTATLLTGQALLREWMAGAAAEHQRVDLAG